MEDIDDFLASLENFRAPSLDSGIRQLNPNFTTTSRPSSSDTSHRRHHHNNNNNNKNKKRKREEEENNNNNNHNSNSNTKTTTTTTTTWSCPRCTLINTIDAATCDACLLARPANLTGPSNNNNNNEMVLVSSSSLPSNTHGEKSKKEERRKHRKTDESDPTAPPITPSSNNNNNNTNNIMVDGVKADPSGRSCPSCTFLNAPLASHCVMCEQYLGPIPNTNNMNNNNNNTTTNEKETHRSGTVSMASDRFHSAVSSCSSRRSAVDASSSSTSNSSSSSDDEFNYNINGEEDDFSSVSSYSLSSSSSSSSTSARLHPANEAVPSPPDTTDQRMLVKFLETLEPVPSTDLPCAEAPVTMRHPNANLQPFQLQALYWMLCQEGYLNLSSSFSSTFSTSSSMIPSNGSGRQVVVNVENNNKDHHDEDENYDEEEQRQQYTNTTQAMQGVCGGILADYMGLGKTRTLIALCEATADRNRRRPPTPTPSQHLNNNNNNNRSNPTSNLHEAATIVNHTNTNNSTATINTKSLASFPFSSFSSSSNTNVNASLNGNIHATLNRPNMNLFRNNHHHNNNNNNNTKSNTFMTQNPLNYNAAKTKLQRQLLRDKGVTGSQVVSGATLIVCPSSLLTQWAAEIRRCVVATPTPRILIYHSGHQKKKTIFQLAQDYDYILTSYTILSYQTLPEQNSSSSSSNPHNTNTNNNNNNSTSPVTPGPLYMIHWERIILDEGHTIRNTRTKASKAVMKLSARARWVATATPLHNSVNDLFALMKFMQVPYFGDVQWWNKQIVSYFNRDPQHPRPVTALRILFSSLLLRRTPDTVVHGKRILDLPPKEIHTEYVSLSPEEKVYYDAIHKSAANKLSHNPNNNNNSYNNNNNRLLFSRAIEMLVRCRQVCLHPYIVVAALQHFDPSSSGEGVQATINRTTTNNNNTASYAGGVSGSNSSRLHEDVARQQAQQEEEKKKKEQEEKARAELQLELVKFIDGVLKRHMKKINTAGEFMQELIDALRQQSLTQRECIICMENLAQPAILPCAHTFCYDCIVHAIDAQHRCPLCKRASKRGEVLRVPMHLLSLENPLAAKEQQQLQQQKNKNDHNGEEEDKNEVNPVEVFLSVAPGPFPQWPIDLSSKTKYLLHQIQHVIPANEQVVVFSYFTTYLSYLYSVLQTQGINCLRYTGELTMRQKEKVLKEFAGESVGIVLSSTNDNNDNNVHDNNNNTVSSSSSFLPPPSPPRVLLASFAACNVGLNLVSANHCFLMEPYWNPGQVEQALHRVHRIGQTRPVHITKLVARGTIEEKIETLCQRKLGLTSICFTDTTNNPNPNNNNTMMGRGNTVTSTRLRTQDLVSLFVDPESSESEGSNNSSNGSDSSESDGEDNHE